MTTEPIACEPGFLVVNKPPGIPTIPDRFGSTSLHDQLQHARGERLWTVHRLDREVGGLLVFARTAAAHRALSMAFEAHLVVKRYAALTEGDAPGPAGTTKRLADRLLRGKKRSYPSPHGKDAVTEATFQGAEAGALRWSLLPKTGRNHQLRVQLASRGWPILGDVLYGATRAWPSGIALHAVALSWPELDGELPARSYEIPSPTAA